MSPSSPELKATGVVTLCFAELKVENKASPTEAMLNTIAVVCNCFDLK